MGDHEPATPIRDQPMRRQIIPAAFNNLLQDIKLARILIHRWVESQRTFEAAAYLSTVILLGSILEEVLLAKIKQNPKEADRAESAPQDRDGKVLPFADWPLGALITVAHECGWLDGDIDDFSPALRDYRNLVRPTEQQRNGVFPDAETCKAAWQAVGAAIGDLTR
jgi:hypothetical protein